ncbi:MAG: IS256 family transposase [Solirubrobacteraceae bacterium]
MSSNVPVAEAIRDEAVLPERVQEALGELVGAAKEGLLALSVGVGLGVLTELMEEEVDDVVGPKGKWNAERTAVRHGHEDGEVTLGGRRVEARRPRVRTADGESEVALSTYQHFADRDPLGRVVLERMLAGVSTRRYRRTQEPVGAEVEVKARSTSKSAVSRTFVERTREALGELMSRQLSDLRLAVMMLDGLELKGRMMIVALGITTEGVKIPLGLWEGSSENATVATALLSDLVERGLDPEQGMLFVIDGSKALRKAVRSVFGEVPVQRCLWHKERNVLGHLPERDRPPIKARMRRAWRETDHPRALEQLRQLADELEHTHPGAAGSLREGMEETLTVIKLGIKGKLRRTLESTNPCESMIDTVRTTQRNVKHWSSGEMGLRWTAAGMLEAEKQFRKVIGYTDLPRLAVAIERRLHLHQPSAATTPEAAIALTM